MDALDLQAVDEAFRTRIVVAVAFRSHAAAQLMGSALGKVRGGLLYDGQLFGLFGQKPLESCVFVGQSLLKLTAGL